MKDSIGVIKAPLRGCPTTPLMRGIVILSKAKNLMDSGTYVFKILRLTSQNDVVGQPFRPYSYENFEGFSASRVVCVFEMK